MEQLFPSKEIFKVCGKTIFVTHGHLYDAKSGLYRITSAAREAGADILLFGHTHMPLTLYEDGLYIMNPGYATDTMRPTALSTSPTRAKLLPIP